MVMHPFPSGPPARSHTLRLVDEIGLAIISGRQKQGSPLPRDSELTARYGVSRTVVREAVKTLSGKGLLQPKARVGTVVRQRSDWNLFDRDVLLWHARAGFTPDFLAHLGEMRLALEPEAAALAATRRTGHQLEAMRGWIDRMERPQIRQKDFVQADLGLHLTIAEAADNPFFRSISTLIEVALVAMLTISSPVEDPRRLAESIMLHADIVDAIARRDQDGARIAMRKVVQQGIDRATGAGPDVAGTS